MLKVVYLRGLVSLVQPKGTFFLVAKYLYQLSNMSGTVTGTTQNENYCPFVVRCLRSKFFVNIPAHHAFFFLTVFNDTCLICFPMLCRMNDLMTLPLNSIFLVTDTGLFVQEDLYQVIEFYFWLNVTISNIQVYPEFAYPNFLCA